MDAVMQRALEKNKQSRYGSAKEFAEAIGRILPGAAEREIRRSAPKPPRQAPPSKPVRMGRQLPDPNPKKDLATGKGLVIGMLVVIAALLATVVWLLASRATEENISAVPVQSVSPVESEM